MNVYVNTVTWMSNSRRGSSWLLDLLNFLHKSWLHFKNLKYAYNCSQLPTDSLVLASILSESEQEFFYAWRFTTNQFVLVPASLRITTGIFFCNWILATSRKVAGSIPDQVIGLFNWPNPSGRSMVLGSTQPFTEMSIRNLPGR
jgi:hypothetical protein